MFFKFVNAKKYDGKHGKGKRKERKIESFFLPEEIDAIDVDRDRFCSMDFEISCTERKKKKKKKGNIRKQQQQQQQSPPSPPLPQQQQQKNKIQKRKSRTKTLKSPAEYSIIFTPHHKNEMNGNYCIILLSPCHFPLPH